MEDKRQAALTNWCIVEYHEVYKSLNNLQAVFGKFGTGTTMLLLVLDTIK